MDCQPTNTPQDYSAWKGPSDVVQSKPLPSSSLLQAIPFCALHFEADDSVTGLGNLPWGTPIIKIFPPLCHDLMF